MKIQIKKINNIPKYTTCIKKLKKQPLINNDTKNCSLSTLPIATAPIIAYLSSATSQNKLKENLTKEALNKKINNSTHNPVTDRVETNNKALERAGVAKSDRAKYINSDGYMNKDGKDICKQANVTSFKGHDPENISQMTLDNAGIEKSEHSMYIESDGSLNEQGKALCKNASIISFKGQDSDIIEELDSTMSDIMADEITTNAIEHSDIIADLGTEQIADLTETLQESLIDGIAETVTDFGVEATDDGILENIIDTIDTFLG